VALLTKPTSASSGSPTPSCATSARRMGRAASRDVGASRRHGTREVVGSAQGRARQAAGAL